MIRTGRPLDPVGVALLTISLGLAIDALLRRDGSLASSSRLSRRQRDGGAPVRFAAMAQFASGARSPRIRDIGNGRGRRVAHAIQFGYWAVLVYLPLFLSAGLLVSMEVAGVALLAATLPMLLVPLIGGRFVTQWGWRRFFVVAFGIIAAGDALLVLAAVSTSPAMRLAATIAGMLTIGIGAALANPQMSSVVLALAPPTQAGMASAVTLIVRQAGFAISIAALGATLTRTDMATAFAAPFAPATFAALVAIVAALILLPARSLKRRRFVASVAQNVRRPSTRRDRQEIRRFQAGAADQRAVDVGDRHQFLRVRGFYRAAIEDADLAALRLKAIGEDTPDKPMNLLDICSRRRQPGADRPDRLIGHHQIGRGRAVRQRALRAARRRYRGSVRHRAAPGSRRCRRWR